MDDSPFQELRFRFGSGSLRLGGAAPSPILSSPATRRLSIGCSEPSLRQTQAPEAKRRLSWLSLQGWMAEAEEVTSARAVKGGLKAEEGVAWEMFTPIQRLLFVAVVSVAAAESRKSRYISHLKKSVEFRDQVLSSMQQKLDSLCEQVNNIKDHSGTGSGDVSPMKSVDIASTEAFGCDKIKFVDCGCWLCDQHRHLSHELVDNNYMKGSNGDEILQYNMSMENVEHEERRMSDLSDMGSSVTSLADIQMNSLAIEQDIYNLKRECEEKDETIKELTSLLDSSEIAGSKRIAELEDIIHRKTLTITRLKRDMVVLEQKVVQLTRLQRPSYSCSNSDEEDLPKIPRMADNLLYDMASTTSPSSSDSDSSSPVNRVHAPVAKTPGLAKTLETPLQSSLSVLTSQKSVPHKSSGSVVDQPTSRNTKPQSGGLLTNMNSRRLRSVTTKSQPRSPRSQPATSPRSQPATSPRSQPATSPRSFQPARSVSSFSKKSQTASPTKTSSTAISSRSRNLSAGGDSKASRRRPLLLRKESKDTTPQKRWA